MGFANQVLWWNGSKWVYWLSTDPQFQSKPSNIFEQAFEERDRLDPHIGQTTDGSWNYHAPKSIY